MSAAPPPPPVSSSARVLPSSTIDAYLLEVSSLLEVGALDCLALDEQLSLVRLAHDRLKDVTSIAPPPVLQRPRVVFLNASGHVVQPPSLGAASMPSSSVKGNRRNGTRETSLRSKRQKS